VKTSDEWRVYLPGTTLLVTLTICSLSFSDRGGPYFMASLAVAAISYLFAVREFFATPKFPRHVVVIGLTLAAVWHIAFLRQPPGTDDDIHRYIWDGRLQKLGYNPYLIVPSDPAFQGLHTPETRTLNNPDLPSPYPPGAQLFFRAVTSIQESTFAMKIAFIVCELAIIFLLFDLLKPNQAGHLVLVFAWNPLLGIEVAGSGHIDILGALLLLASAAALAHKWRMTAAVTFALAVMVKFLPIVLLPLYWKKIRIRDAALGAAIVILLYVPFLHHGQIPTGSLGTYVQSFRFNGPVFAALNRVAPPNLLAALALLVGLATAAWLRKKRPDSPAAFALPMAATLVFAPAVFPWYLVWLLPFLTSPSTLLLILWTVTISLTYIQWHLRTLGHPWGALPTWIMLVEYGLLAIAAVLMALPKRTRRRTSSIA